MAVDNKFRLLVCQHILSLKQLVYCVNTLIFLALVVCYLIASLIPPVAERPVIRPVHSDVIHTHASNGGQYINRSNNKRASSTRDRLQIDFGFELNGLHGIQPNTDFQNNGNDSRSHFFHGSSRNGKDSHQNIEDFPITEDNIHEPSKLIKDIEALLNSVPDSIITDKSTSRILVELLQFFFDHQQAPGQSEAISAITDGLLNMQLVRLADTRRDLKYLENLTFLPNFTNPCWLEPIWPGSFYRTTPYISRSKLRRTAGTYRQRLEGKKVSWRLRCLPAFFLAGFPKCATTELFSKLILHHDLHQPLIKEPHWWTRRHLGLRREKPRENFENYITYFDEAANSVAFSSMDGENHKGLVFDASASTIWDFTMFSHSKKYENASIEDVELYSEDLPFYNLSRLLPKSKAIVLLRNPTERAYSDFLYFHEETLKDMSADRILSLFRENIIIQIAKYHQCTDVRHNSTLCTYWLQKKNAKVRLYVGMYHVYLKQWLKFFQRESLLVMRTEDYSLNPVDAINKISEFLDTDSLPETVADMIRTNNSTRRNSRNWSAPELSPGSRIILDEFYRGFNKELSILLADERFLWNDST